MAILVFLVAQQWRMKILGFEHPSKVGEGGYLYPTNFSAHWRRIADSAGQFSESAGRQTGRQCGARNAGSAGVHSPAVPAWNRRQCRGAHTGSASPVLPAVPDRA